MQFYVLNKIINNGIDDAKTKNYVRNVLIQLLLGSYGGYNASFFDIANQTVITTILQYLKLSTDAGMQLGGSVLFSLVTEAQNYQPMLYELFKRSESQYLLTQILLQENQAFLHNISDRYSSQLKSVGNLPLLGKELREFGQRCIDGTKNVTRSR